MADENVNFVANLVKADQNYLDRLNSEIVLGIVQIFDYVPIPKDIERAASYVVDKGLQRLIRKSRGAWEEAYEAAVDPDSKGCYSSLFAKDLGDFLAKAEVKFATDMIESTYLEDYIAIPENTEYIVNRMLAIPVCE
jgi:hypothetical protein